MNCRKLPLLSLAALSLSLAVTASACGGSEDGGDDDRPDELHLPGTSFYPESLSAAPDGTLYVGSIGQGELWKFEPGSDAAVQVVPGSATQTNIAGVLVDPAGTTAYLCSVDLGFARNSEVKVVDLATETVTATLTFPAFSFCNDLVLDGAGNLYVSDSFGRIWRRDGAAFEEWHTSSHVAPVGTSGVAAFAANGIAWDGAGALYVNNIGASTLVRIPILANGSAGTPQPITLSQPIVLPDGMRMDGADSLLLVEGGAGRVSRITLSGANGSVTHVATDLDGPTSLIRAEDGLWVTEGQVAILFGLVDGDPNLPFKVRRIEE